MSAYFPSNHLKFKISFILFSLKERITNFVPLHFTIKAIRTPKRQMFQNKSAEIGEGTGDPSQKNPIQFLT
jgi:hypothetical protein